jgi:hypothetical protein
VQAASLPAAAQGTSTQTLSQAGQVASATTGRELHATAVQGTEVVAGSAIPVVMSQDQSNHDQVSPLYP